MKMIITFFCLFTIFLRAPEDKIMTYIYNAPESTKDKRYHYQWEILQTALEKTKDKYGPYTMKPSQPMQEKRQISELKKASGKLTVMYLDDFPEFEDHLIPIRIPVDKNFVGYRIFLIRKEDQAIFRNIQEIEDLKILKAGLGIGWMDVKILEHYKFKIVTGSNYEGLFKMLINKRFDYFSRGANEVLDEYNQHKSQMTDLCIENSLVLYYPLPMYFWFSKTDEGKQLANRAEEGMRLMINDGTYDKIFLKYHSNTINELNLNKRRIFTIENPFLVKETPFKDKKLWFIPGK